MNTPQLPGHNSIASAVAGATTISLQRLEDPRGVLVVAQSGEQVPFQTQRMFFLSDVTLGSERGHHAHRSCHELLVVPTGAVTIELDDSRRRWQHRLAEPNQALHIPPMTWIVLREFAVGTICVVLASERYDPADYIRDYQEFVAAAGRMSR